MALTATTVFDLSAQTQTITFNNPSMVDQISFSSNQMTFAEISTFNLVKSDVLLYGQYLKAFYNLLAINFPYITINYNLAWPLSEFDITISDVGVKKVDYTQNSIGVNVYTINYVPLATSASFTARAAPVVITLQEFLQTVSMMNAFINQVNLN